MAVDGVLLERERLELGEELGGEPGAHDEPQRDRRHLDGDDLVELVADALGRDDLEARCELARRGRERLVGDQLEAREEPRGAQHPQRVVAEGDLGVEGGGEPVLGEVRHAPERVDEPQGRQVQRHGVDREVAARQVHLDVVAEGDRGLARVGSVDLGAVGGDLEGPPRDAEPDGAEGAALLPDLVGDPPDEPHDLVGARVGRAVEVDRVEVDVADERVADRAAHEVEAAVRAIEDLGERRGGLEQRPQARRDTRRGHFGEGTSPR